MTHATKRTIAGRIALMAGHCAGMVDLVALPVWVGALISLYGFDPQQAGLLATLFLGSAVVASAWLAPRFAGLRTRPVAAIGFAVTALAFAAAASAKQLAPMAALHALAGLACGAALSVTHGTMGRSANPHREFAAASMALGVFAVVFLGATPQLIAAAGGPALFYVFAGVMTTAAFLCAVAFPSHDRAEAAAATTRPREPVPRPAWFGMAGIAGMALVQSMTFSFLERVGNDRGFGADSVTAVLVALGIVNLFPAGLAALLQRRWPAVTVMRIGPVVQALLVVVIMNSPSFGPYAAAASVFAAVVIFTHVFAFGLLARLDPSGRTVAATPAMVMIGACLGPVLGGTLVKIFGYGSLGAAALLIDALAVLCFMRIPASPISVMRAEATT